MSATLAVMWMDASNGKRIGSGWRTGLAALALLASACQPTVRVEAPREPITINLNVKLDAEVRVKVEEQAKQDVANNPIF